MYVSMNFDFDKVSKKPLITKLIINIFLWVAEITAVIFLAYFIVHYAIEKTDMIGASMETTLSNSNPIIINKFSYRFSDPKRFDVVVFKQSGKEHSYYNIKRIIGLPGETVLLKEDHIYIDGEVIEDIILVEPMVNYGLAKEEILLEENEYFVLGDNRNNSEDSRFASVGNILADDIIGKASIRFSPFNFINKINLKPDNKVEEQ